MDLATIEPALAALASTLTGVEASCCVWENAPRPRHNGRLVLLSWVSIVGAGVDETAWAYEENADPLLEMTPTVVGQRKATLQLSVEVLDQRSGSNARQLAERARTLAQGPTSLAALLAVGLAFASAEPVVQADYKVDGRMVSRCTVDLHLNAMSAVVDTAAQTSYIASVTTTSTITHPDGTAVDPDIAPGGTAP